jgi:hypothetical protein
MKTIVKLIASFMVIAAFAIACSPKSENSENSEAAATDSVETVAPADELPSDSTQVVDSTAVH